ncbi:MAG: hypothetical protein EBT70_13960 [Betaproteobacteria bacterium]|nr:hypothetical protein [Betaproteobacteria bacterium]
MHGHATRSEDHASSRIAVRMSSISRWKCRMLWALTNVGPSISSAIKRCRRYARLNPPAQASQSQEGSIGSESSANRAFLRRIGPWGVNAFNAQLQRALGFADAPWFVGRAVVVRRNDYALGLMNGDTGVCLPRMVDGVARLRVAFADGQGGVRWLVPGRLAAVDTVFAMTVHQSQGSEFDQVLLVLPDQPAPLLTRELVYTGMTRARQQLCVWAPDPSLFVAACERTVRRSGGLAAR